MCVLPDTDLDGAKTVAEHLLMAVADQAIAHQHSDVAPHVTVSIGVTSKQLSICQ